MEFNHVFSQITGLCSRQVSLHCIIFIIEIVCISARFLTEIRWLLAFLVDPRTYQYCWFLTDYGTIWHHLHSHPKDNQPHFLWGYISYYILVFPALFLYIAVWQQCNIQKSTVGTVLSDIPERQGIRTFCTWLPWNVECNHSRGWTSTLIPHFFDVHIQSNLSYVAIQGIMQSGCLRQMAT